MKRLFIFLMVLGFVFGMAGPLIAGGCGDRQYGGECINPGQPDTGSLGTSSYPWGEIWSSDLRDPTRVTRIPVQLPSVFVYGSGQVTSTTKPALTAADNVSKLVWSNYADASTVIQFKYYPHTNMTEAVINMFANTGAVTFTPGSVGFDWSIYVYDHSAAFGTAIAQSDVELINTNTSTSSQLLQFTINSTGLAAITSGSSGVVISIVPEMTYTSGSLEISDIWINETGF